MSSKLMHKEKSYIKENYYADANKYEKPHRTMLRY